MLNLAWLEARQGCHDFTDDRPKVFDAIGPSPNNEDTKRQAAEFVLMFELAIHCEEGIDQTTRPS
jgi:hypothetical protein